jgi:hypothetical protein
VTDTYSGQLILEVPLAFSHLLVERFPPKRDVILLPLRLDLHPCPDPLGSDWSYMASAQMSDLVNGKPPRYADDHVPARKKA